MFLALLLIFVVTFAGTLLTYLYAERATLPVRLAMGLITGLVTQSFLTYALALRVSLSPTVCLVATLPLLTPLILLRSETIRRNLLHDIQRSLARFRNSFSCKRRWATTLITLLLAGLLLSVFRGTTYLDRGDFYTNNHHNLGDLPWHVGIVQGFAVGGNYPPEHLQFAGSRLTYPYMADFVVAELVTFGVPLTEAFFLHNAVLILSLLVLLQHWAARLTGSRFALVVVPLFLFFSGGWGWLMVFEDLPKSGLTLPDFLQHLPHDYTLYEEKYRWGNSLTVLFTTQRSLLFGMPLGLIVLTLLWEARRRPERPNILLTWAGAFAGLLPLVHTHTSLVLLVVGFLQILTLKRQTTQQNTKLLPLPFPLSSLVPFLLAYTVFAAPQALMLLSGTKAHTSHFFGFQWGWDSKEWNVLTFWLRNTGPLFPLLFLAWFPNRFLTGWLTGRRPLLSPSRRRYLLPFAFWWVFPNIYKFAPWVWDNIKVLIYGYLSFLPPVALILARMARRSWAGRLTAIALVVLSLLSGMLDVWRINGGQFRQRIFTAEGIAFAEKVSRAVPHRARMIHAPKADHVAMLTGRRFLCGYPGHLWSHGFDYAEREADVKKIYAGSPDAETLLKKYAIDYIIVGPAERVELGIPLNDTYLNRFPVIVEHGEYRLLGVQH